MRHATAPATTMRTSPRHGWRDIVFSVAEARRALPYIARLVADASQAYTIIQQCRETLDGMSTPAARTTRNDVCERRDQAIARLNAAIDDCNAVGAHLLDLPSGRVSLPCLIEDRPTSLLWSLGDDLDAAWTDLC